MAAGLRERLAPRDHGWRHDDFDAREGDLPPDEPANGHAHARALLLGASECLNLAGGELVLGRWQRIFFVELDGPRSLVREMPLNERGELVKAWPGGFFEEGLREIF